MDGARLRDDRAAAHGERQVGQEDGEVPLPPRGGVPGPCRRARRRRPVARPAGRSARRSARTCREGAPRAARGCRCSRSSASRADAPGGATKPTTTASASVPVWRPPVLRRPAGSSRSPSRRERSRDHAIAGCSGPLGPSRNRVRSDLGPATGSVLQLPIRIARQTPEVIVDLIEDAVRECIAKSGIDAAAVKGIGIGVPGIVDPRSGQSHASSVFGERADADRATARKAHGHAGED